MSKQGVELINTPNYEEIKQNFLQDLIRASQGKPSSISFLKNTLSPQPLVTSGSVQAIVIGGSNYIASTITINHSAKKNVLNRQSGTLPLFKTKQDLAEFLNDIIDSRANAIGLNFGFTIKPFMNTQGEPDAMIIHSHIAKEHSFSGLNESLGTLVKSLFFKKFNKKIKVAVANDTVCLALSGSHNENAALINGTGINMSLKLEDSAGISIVNLEAGNFNKFDQPRVLKILDARSERPGTYLFEKITSGKYLFLIFNELIKMHNLNTSQLSSSEELSMLCQTKNSDLGAHLARDLMKQSASLLASMIAATYEFSGSPHSFVIIGEGSLLWKGWRYQENIQKQLNKLGIPPNTVTIKNIPDSSINGALGLLIK